MLKKISNLPFKGTAEQEAKLNDVINASKHDKSLLMAVMQEAQEIYGYLPMEVQTKIAEGMEVPLPGDCDKYLKNLYGDYMQIPPPEKRERHLVVSLKL